MPGDDTYGDGMRLVKYLVRHYPKVQVLVLTMVSNPMIISALYDAGVAAVVLKRDNLAEIVTALRTLQSGRRYYPPGFLRDGAVDARSKFIGERINSLSPKEFEVLRHFIRGESMMQVAETLKRSVKTVSGQKISAMRKLDVQTDQELVAFCVESELFQSVSRAVAARRAGGQDPETRQETLRHQQRLIPPPEQGTARPQPGRRCAGIPRHRVGHQKQRRAGRQPRHLEGRSPHVGIVIQHAAQRSLAQAAHAAPCIPRSRQRRQAARRHAFQAIDRHFHFTQPAGRARRQAHGARLVIAGGIRAFLPHAQSKLAQPPQPIGQRTGQSQALPLPGDKTA